MGSVLCCTHLYQLQQTRLSCGKSIKNLRSLPQCLISLSGYRFPCSLWVLRWAVLLPATVIQGNAMGFALASECPQLVVHNHFHWPEPAVELPFQGRLGSRRLYRRQEVGVVGRQCSILYSHSSFDSQHFEKRETKSTCSISGF